MTESTDPAREPRGGGRRGAAQPLYGWPVVGTLAVTETVSYGVLLYAFPVVLPAMQAELGWRQEALTGAYSIALLVSGVAAVPVGRWIDRHGARGVMTTGALAASALVAGWSRADAQPTFFLLWAGIGICMATLFYEPAFTALAQRFHGSRRLRAVTVVTVAAAFASTIFVPLTATLVEGVGWRGAILWLSLLLPLLVALPHWLFLKRAPAQEVSAAEERRPISGRGDLEGVLRSRPFRRLTFAFFLATFVNIALTVHLIPILLDRGYTLSHASLALGAVGLMKVVGRLGLVPMAEAISTQAAPAAVFLCQALGILALIALPGVAGIWVCVSLFGAGEGASTPARAELIAMTSDAAMYGGVSGVMAMILAGARAAGPAGGSWVQVASGGYDLLLVLMTGALALAAWSIGSSGTRRVAGAA